jgi:cell wall-associated NlpC family hydrolase
MGWAASYLGIRYAAHGRTRAGLDCWGLVKLVYAEQRGMVLADFAHVDPENGDAVAAAVDAERVSWAEVNFDQRREFDVVVMIGRIATARGSARPRMHIGVVTPDLKILHCEWPVGVSCVAASHPAVVNRVAGVYRR